jgi:hypothetical protein
MQPYQNKLWLQTLLVDILYLNNLPCVVSHIVLTIYINL